MTPDKVSTWMGALGGRRYIMCVGSGVVSTGLLMLHYLDPSNFQIIILGTIGAYIAGNSFERHGPDEDYSSRQVRMSVSGPGPDPVVSTTIVTKSPNPDSYDVRN